MSLGSTTNTFLADLIKAGADAMSNLYYVEFSGTFLDSNEEVKVGLKVRNKDFTTPVFSQSQKNSVHYMTANLDWPMAVVSGDKSLSLNIRLDEDYKIYEFLLRQQAVTSIPNLAFATNHVPDSNNGGFRIDVYAFDRSKSEDPEAPSDPFADPTGYTKLYSFEYCWIKQISGLNYSYDSPTALTLTAEIGFFQYDDPMNLLVGE